MIAPLPSAIADMTINFFGTVGCRCRHGSAQSVRLNTTADEMCRRRTVIGEVASLWAAKPKVGQRSANTSPKI
jgi:hypothetical protein